MSVLDVINSLCIEVDADMRAQRAAQLRRARYSLHVNGVLQLKRCPDWPEERIIAYASSRATWCAADIAEDGLAGKILPGDAIWLLLQPGLLPVSLHGVFLLACADAAMGFAGPELEAAKAAKTRTEADWRAAELSLRASARAHSLAKDEAKARQLSRCSRVAGLAASWLRNEFKVREEINLSALQASHLTMHSHPLGVLPEVQRQLQHLHALVT